MEWINSLLDVIKNRTIWMTWALCLASGYLAMAPDRMIPDLWLRGFRREHGWAFFVAFIFFCGLAALESIGPRIQDAVGKWFVVHEGCKRLKKLTADEQAVLRRYIERGTRSQYFGVYDPVVCGLVREGFLYSASRLGDFTRWGFNIVPWVWDYLNDHPELVGLPERRTGPQDKQQIRPPSPE